MEKAKLRWLIDGDRGFKIFHTFAKAKAVKSMIYAMHANDACLTVEKDIMDQVIDFYQILISSTSTVSTIRITYIIPRFIFWYVKSYVY